MKKVLCLLLCLAVIGATTFTVGCGGGSSSLKAFSAFLIIAAACTTGGGAAVAFAASERADLRAANQTKYEAVLFIDGSEVATSKNITITSTKLSLDEPFSYESKKENVEYKVVFRTQGKDVGFTYIGNANLTEGTPTEVGSINAPIEVTAETTAKAITYELWKEKDGAQNKTYSDFESVTNTDDFANNLASIIEKTNEDLVKIFDENATDFTAAKEVAATVAVALPVPATKRLSGNYRCFSYSALHYERWLSVSNFTFSGNNGSLKDILGSDGTLTDINFNFVETDGLITINNTWRGAVSPSGNYVALHKFDSDDSAISFGVKLPTNATNALLNGDYRCYCLTETVTNSGNNPREPKFTVHVVNFDGNGNAVGKEILLNEDDTGDIEFTYSISADGKWTSSGNPNPHYYQVSADGNVIILTEYGSDRSELVIGVRVGSGMSNSDLPSRFFEMGHISGHNNPYSYSESYNGARNNGTVSLTNGKSELGDRSNESNPDGTISANGTSDSNSSWASVSPDKELTVCLEREGNERYFGIDIKR